MMDSFGEVSKLFYNRNFGSASKADIELLMFHLFMEQRRQSSDSLSDYCVGNELGITQQRVRNLKIKEQLKYPRDIDWKTSLSELLKNARYDDPNIVIDVPDPIVLIEIKNYLEEQGKYINLQRNSRLLSVRIEFFVDLAIEVDDKKDQKEIYKELIKELQKHDTYEEGKLHPNMNKCKDIVAAGVDITTIVANLATILTPGNLVFDGISSVLRSVGGK